MCRTEDETWNHVLVCSTRIQWTRQWLDEAKINDFETDYDLRQATTLEAKRMNRLQVEVL